MKMKMKINYLIIICSIVLGLSSCDDAMHSNLPDEYATILYLKENGLKTIDIINVENEDKILNIIVGKGGNNPEGKATAKIITMSETELNEYNNKYYILPENCYTLPPEFEFSNNDNSKEIEITLKSSEIVKLIQKDNKEYVLPLLLVSEEKVINEKSNTLIIKPTISSAKVSINMLNTSPGYVYKKEGSTEELKFNIEFLLNTENKWDFTCTLEDDENELQKLVNEYNSSMGTNYNLLTKDAYHMDKVRFINGINFTDYSLIVEKEVCNSLTAGEYLIPIKIKEMSLDFSFDNTKAVFIQVSIQNNYGQIDLTGKLTANAEYNDSQTVNAMIDNNPTTFWQSEWTDDKNDYEENKYKWWDPKYGAYFDINLGTNYDVINFSYQTRHNSSVSFPAEIQLYGSSDGGINWEAIGKLTREGNNLPDSKSEIFNSEDYDNISSYTLLRFSITKNYDAIKYIENDLCDYTLLKSVCIAEFKLFGKKSN